MYAKGMCLLKNVGDSEKSRLITANVQRDDLLLSRVHAAIFATGQWLR